MVTLVPELAVVLQVHDCPLLWLQETGLPLMVDELEVAVTL